MSYGEMTEWTTYGKIIAGENGYMSGATLSIKNPYELS
jgi:hypothetical protein